MRVVIVGTSGAGKTTLARRIANALALTHVELDALHWEGNWRALTEHDPDEFVRRVSVAVRKDNWVVDGNYGIVRDLIWNRATHLVWLDYDRHVIMGRVIRRSIIRVIFRTELWAGNREEWSRMHRSSHPIRWAWSTWRRRRREIEERLARPEYAHMTAYRVLRPLDAESVILQLGSQMTRSWDESGRSDIIVDTQSRIGGDEDAERRAGTSVH
jgi:adenylate kinase family enzyme